jgi:hypothetical protein
MSNPFYLQVVPVDAPFCNRIVELRELASYAEARANVVLYSPRRYGKTSLVRRVQQGLADQGAVTIFVDFFGVASVDEVASRLAKAVFAVTHRKEPLWKKALRTMQAFRPVLKPDAEGGFALSVEPAAAGNGGLPLLEATIDALGEFIESAGSLVQVTFDEFQEIVVLTEALQVEAALRTRIQHHTASYFFVGSRRRVLLGMFNERQRPFFQSAINYPLNPLPPEELAEFITLQFAGAGKSCTPEVAGSLAALVRHHPYYAEKLAFFVYELAEAVSAEALGEGLERLVAAERPVFEAIILGLPSQQRRLLQALAAEPTAQLLASAYLRRHNLGSVGGVQHAAKQLEELDLIEREGEGGPWRLVDPVFAMWQTRQREERLG